MTTEAFKTGQAVLAEMFGAEFPERAMARQTDLSRSFQELLTSFCFGELWSRPGLARDARSMVTIAMLIAQNRPEELRNHIRGAIANGVTKEQIMEIVMHALGYCGAPLAVSAQRTALDELQKMGLEQAPQTGAKP